MSRSPGDPLRRSAKDLVAEADAKVRALTPSEVADLLEDSAYLVVDIRDPREMEKLGTLPGAFRAPRGMLEFWIDPESPYAKPVFQQRKKFIFHCAGGWRSALAAKTAQDMGLSPVAHLGGGFTAWREAGEAVERVEPRLRKS